MDRASATAIIVEVLEIDPERVFDVIANVVCSMAEGGRYSGAKSARLLTNCCRNSTGTSSSVINHCGLFSSPEVLVSDRAKRAAEAIRTGPPARRQARI